MVYYIRLCERKGTPLAKVFLPSELAVTLKNALGNKKALSAAD